MTEIESDASLDDVTAQLASIKESMLTFAQVMTLHNEHSTNEESHSEERIYENQNNVVNKNEQLS